MRKLFVSVFSVLTILAWAGFVIALLQLVFHFGEWSAIGLRNVNDSETGKPVEMRFDVQLDRYTSTMNLDMYKRFAENEENRKLLNLEIMPWTTHMLWFYANVMHWCALPAVEAANVTGWILVSFITAMINMVIYQVAKSAYERRGDVAPSSYRPAICKPLTIYFVVVLVLTNCLDDKMLAIFWSAAVAFLGEIVRFVLHRVGILNESTIDAICATSHDNGDDDDRNGNAGRGRVRGRRPSFNIGNFFERLFSRW